MKICVIGCSGHTGYVFAGLQGNTEDRIVGLAPGSAGEDVKRLLEPCRKLGSEPRVFDHHERMLDELRPEIAVVTPHFCDHARAGIAALERGCHLFIEKPAALTFEDLDALRAAQTAAGTHLVPMLGLRYDPAMLAAWEAVQAGGIGAVRLLTGQKSYRLGKRADFYRQRQTYGGTIPWVGSHAIDWFSWFTGREFLSVWAQHSTACNQDHGELEVNALCQFALEGGIMASANIDYLRPTNAPTHGDDRLRVAGATGVVEVRDGRAWLINDEAEGLQELTPVKRGPLFADVLRLVRDEGDCLLATEDTFRVTDACLRARQSADEGRAIPFAAAPA